MVTPEPREQLLGRQREREVLDRAFRDHDIDTEEGLRWLSLAGRAAGFIWDYEGVGLGVRPALSSRRPTEPCENRDRVADRDALGDSLAS
jgi:hypothetical protein